MLTIGPRPADALAGLPAVTRATGLISGLIRQMTIDVFRGPVQVAGTRLTARPDPSPGWGRGRFVGVHVDDYLRHGNAVHLITARDGDGVPVAAMWLPAVHVWVSDQRAHGGQLSYWYAGRELPLADVVHVARGADPDNPARGVGVIEQHLTTWGRLTKQARFEEDSYDRSGVPSVAVVVGNQDLTTASAEEAKERWMEKFQRREPVFLPQGTEVKPLAWSPSDSQMVEAHAMALQDVANAFGLDGFWVGVPSKGLTYKSPAPLFLSLVRETIEPISDDFEQSWGPSWLPLSEVTGEELLFRKADILTDDMASEMAWLALGVEKKILDVDEARARIRMSPRGNNQGPATDVDADKARAAAEVSQKVYLAVTNDVLTQAEGRDLIRRAGGNLKEN